MGIYIIINYSTAQVVYEHVSNKDIYMFLEELANEKVIHINSVVKPYSRTYIAQKLNEAYQTREKLSLYLQKELDFYLRDYNKELLPGKNFQKRLDLFYYKDSLFTLSINPILGIQYWSNENGTNYHRWNGAEAFAYLGDRLGVYASLRDNHEKIKFSNEDYLNTRPGANYKARYDFSEMRGGITWTWKWGTIGLVKDHFEWGQHVYYPNIFSAKIPSAAQVKLNLKPTSWFEFNYIHAWLVSEVIDSARSQYYTNSYGTSMRQVFKPKFLSTNMFTFKPWQTIGLSLGNSIIYSDMGLHPAYMIPVMFYKSIDHTLNSTGPNQLGQNSQMFFDASIRSIKHLHLFATIFIDELSIARFTKPDELNFVSYRTGFNLTNLIPKTYARFEYTRTNPLVYQHDMPTTTFESNYYNLGHYLKDNSREIFASVGFKPARGLDLRLSYILSQRGKDYTALGVRRVGNPYLDSIEWEKKEISFVAKYQVINNGWIFMEFLSRDVKGVESYYPEFFHGKTSTITLGANVGF
ncbi:MAG: hypothetical protein ACOC3S_00010 [Bacteroidota bacterium]